MRFIKNTDCWDVMLDTGDFIGYLYKEPDNIWVFYVDDSEDTEFTYLTAHMMEQLTKQLDRLNND